MITYAFVSVLNAHDKIAGGIPNLLMSRDLITSAACLMVRVIVFIVMHYLNFEKIMYP